MSEALCELCGLPMPEGEEMFNYHGYSGPCPKQQKSHGDYTEVSPNVRKFTGQHCAQCGQPIALSHVIEDNTHAAAASPQAPAPQTVARKITKKLCETYELNASEQEDLVIDIGRELSKYISSAPGESPGLEGIAQEIAEQFALSKPSYLRDKEVAHWKPTILAILSRSLEGRGQIFQLKGENMNFGQAIEALKNGQKVSRSGWNGKGMWLGYVPADQWGLGSGAPYDYGLVGNSLLPWIGMKTADGAFVPWLASQTDVLAEDWGIVA